MSVSLVLTVFAREAEIDASNVAEVNMTPASIVVPNVAPIVSVTDPPLVYPFVNVVDN